MILSLVSPNKNADRLYSVDFVSKDVFHSVD